MISRNLSKEKISLADKKSDHRVQANVPAKMVSQNVQGPYGIKFNKEGEWAFDLPIFLKANNTPYALIKLKEFTGMDEEEVKALLEAMTEDNQNPPVDFDTSKVKQFFEKNKQRYPGLGDSLGEGNYRWAIEHNKA